MSRRSKPTLTQRVTSVVVLASTLGILPTQQADAAPVDRQDAVVKLINAERARHGLQPVVRHSGLDSLAQGWTDHVAATWDYSHNPALYLTPISGVSVTSEILAGQLADDPRADGGSVQAWVDSPRHHEIMLLPGQELAGVGVTCNENICFYVVDFGRRVSTTPISQPMPTVGPSPVMTPPTATAPIAPAPQIARRGRSVRH